MKLTRRDTVKLGGAAAFAAIAPRTLAQGVDLTRDKIPMRLSLDEFVRDDALMAGLRRGVRAMKARKPSDPLSWFYQASIHGVTIELIQIEAAKDPNLIAVDQKKFWNQCPHFGQASANFLPWHRAYTHYFERILRAHTGEPRFALPYWNYHEPANYYFPREFGRQKLDEPLDGDISNPLYHPFRNSYFCEWQHWTNDKDFKPYSQLTPEAVDWARARNSPIFFGRHEREGLAGAVADEDVMSRGLMESFPHDPIHRLVGGVIPQPPLPNPDDPAKPIPQPSIAGGMANPPTAGFDPIFCVHHANIDRLWAEWSCLAGKDWGALPPQSWLEDAPWSFFDVTLKDGKLQPVEVNRPRQDFFDYRALGVAFKSEDLSKTPLKLPMPKPDLLAEVKKGQALLAATIDVKGLLVNAMPERISIAPEADVLRVPFAAQTATANNAAQKRVLMRLSGINLGTVSATGFEVHLVRDAASRPKRGDPTFVGTIALFRHDGPAPGGHSGHAGHGTGTNPPSDTFDITDVIRAQGEVDPSKMFVVIVPYSLSQTTDGNKAIVETGSLSFDSIEFLTQ